jgi:uncharacterized protein
VVKAIQTKNGSRSAYARVEKAGAWPTEITPDAAQLIEAQTSAFFATANSGGQPYIQRRGGPPGFPKVLNETTIGFADFSGNRQYISIGNLAENPKACLFLIDYVHRRRIKLWGKAEVVEDDADLLTRLMPQDYTARPERAILFRLAAFDSNCPQHIPQRFEAADVAAALQQRYLRIAALEGELAALGRSAA